MGLVKFYGKQLVIALIGLAPLLLLNTYAGVSVMRAVGRVAESGPFGLAAAALLGFIPPILAMWRDLRRYEGLPGRPAPPLPDGRDLISWLIVALTAATFFVATSRYVFEPSKWYEASINTMSLYLGSWAPGLTELGAIGTMLGPLTVGYFFLQFTFIRAPKHKDDVLYGRTWPWIAAGLWLIGGVAGVFWLTR